MNLAEAPVVTRSEAEAQAIAEYRSETLRMLTPAWQWSGLISVALLLMSVLIMIVDPLAWLIAGGLIISFGVGFVARRFLEKDRETRIRAAMTPVIRISALKGEISMLRSAIGLLITTTSSSDPKPVVLRQAVQILYQAIRPLMARGVTTIENATVAGYPAYPDIEVMTMPGDDDDLIGFHVMRIEATLQRLESLADGDVVLNETISQVAGEIVPPLRAIEAQI